MHVHTTGCSYHRDSAAVVVRRQPLWTYLISVTIDLLCALTRHHWCNSRLVHWSIRLSDRHAEQFSVPVPEQLAIDFERWRGWRNWDIPSDTADDE